MTSASTKARLLEIGTVITYDGRQGEIVGYGPDDTYEVLDFENVSVFDIPVKEAVAQ